jgi:type I restriction enzyme S subunit
MARTIPRGWQELEINEFLQFTPREVQKPKGQYRSLGIRSHCKGTFLREVEDPDKVMMETLYAVKKNDLIVNITFAWEGAVALVKESDEGALVSHRFPTYVFDRNVVIPEFFQYLIPSKRFVL